MLAKLPSCFRGCFQARGFGKRQDADDSDDNQGHAWGSRLAGRRGTAYSRAVPLRHRFFVISYVNAKHQCFGGEDPALLLVVPNHCTRADNDPLGGVHAFGNQPAEALFFDIATQPPNPKPSHEFLSFLQNREPRLTLELISQLGRVAVEADSRSSCSTKNGRKKKKKLKIKNAASHSAIFSSLPLYLAAETFAAAGGDGQCMGLPTPWQYVVAQPCSLRTPSWAMKEFSNLSLAPSRHLVPPDDHQRSPDGPQAPEPTLHALDLRQSRPPLAHCRPPPLQASLNVPPHHEGGDVMDLPALLVRFVLQSRADNGPRPPSMQASAEPQRTQRQMQASDNSRRNPGPQVALTPDSSGSAVQSQLREQQPSAVSMPLCMEAILSGLACAVTAIDVNSGRALYQNAASVAFWGDQVTHEATEAEAEWDGTAIMMEAAASIAATDLAADATSAAVTVMKLGLTSRLVDVKPASVSQVVTGRLEAGSQGQQNADGVPQSSAVAVAAAHLGARAVSGSVQRCAAESTVQESPSCGSMGSCTRDSRCPWPAIGPLQHLFLLEPSKLERMLHDTCIEGRAWRGIVRVPAFPGPLGPGGSTDDTNKGMEASLKAGNIQNLLSSVPGGATSIGGGHGDSRVSACTRILETMLGRPSIPPLQPPNAISKESPVNADGETERASSWAHDRSSTGQYPYRTGGGGEHPFSLILSVDTNRARRSCTDTAADGRNTKTPSVAGRWGGGGRVSHVSDIAAGPPSRAEADSVDYTRASGGDCTATAVTAAAAAAAAVTTSTSTFTASTVMMGTMPSNRNAISHKASFVEFDADPLATSVWGVLGEATSDQGGLGVGAPARHLMAPAGGVLSPEKVSNIEQLLKTTPLLIATAVMDKKDGSVGYDRAGRDGGNSSVNYHHFQHVRTDDHGAESGLHPPLATADLFPRDTARTEPHLVSSARVSAGFATSFPTEGNTVQTLETQRNVLSSPPQNLHILDSMKGALHQGGLLDIRTLGLPSLPQPPLQQQRSSIPPLLQQPQQSPTQSQSQVPQSPQSLASPHGLSQTLQMAAPWACSPTANGTPASYRLRQGLRGRSLLRHTTGRSTCVGNTVSGSSKPGELLRMLTKARTSELTATVSPMSITAGRPTAMSPQTPLSTNTFGLCSGLGLWGSYGHSSRGGGGYRGMQGVQSEVDETFTGSGGAPMIKNFSTRPLRTSKSFLLLPRTPSSPALPRVVTFASSLRNAPQPVQQVVQVARQTSFVESSEPAPIVNSMAAGGGGVPSGFSRAASSSAIPYGVSAVIQVSSSPKVRPMATPTVPSVKRPSQCPTAYGPSVDGETTPAQAHAILRAHASRSVTEAVAGAVWSRDSTHSRRPPYGGDGDNPNYGDPCMGTLSLTFSRRYLCGLMVATARRSQQPFGLPGPHRLMEGEAAAMAEEDEVVVALEDAVEDVVGPVAAARLGEEGGPVPTHIPGEEDCWHEVVTTRHVDPKTGRVVLLLMQTDVTVKVSAERHIALVSETEHRLLEQIFPRHVLAYMTEEGGPWGAPENPDPNRWRPMVRDINKLATSHDEVTLLFADIQGFTPMCKVLEPRVVMAFLNDLFTRFDRRLDEFGVYKVETIGDCYMVAGGLVHEDEDGMVAVRNGAGHKDRLHAERVFMFAKAMLSAASRMSLPTTGGPVKMRIGIHSGPVVSGVVGQRMPRFCLFGDTVNTASRMESTGVPGCIHASEAARALLRNEAWVATGGIEVKGRGLMQTYVWSPPDAGMVKTEAAGGMPSLEWKATTSSIGNPHGCWDKRWSQRQSQRHSQRLRNLQAQARTAGLTNSQLSRSCSAMQHSHTQVQAQSQSHIGKASRLHGDSTYYVDANGSSTLGGGAATAASATAAPAFISTHADPSKAMCAQPLALLSSALLPSPGWGGAGAAAAGASGSNSAEDGDSDSVSSSSGDSCVALAALLLESGIPEGPLRAPVVPPTGRLAAA